MATGRLPFPYEDISKVMDAHVNESTPNPCEVNPEIPEPLGEIIVRATRKDPGERFQGVTDLLRHLLPIAAECGARPLKATRGPKRMLNLSLRYENEQQAELNLVLEDFARSLKNLGIEVFTGALDKI